MTPVILAAAGLDTGDTAWLLAATALVLLMTPGLALFYGGMVRSKSVLNMLMMSFVSIALVTVVWLVAGYSLAFGDDVFAGLIGNLHHVGLAGIGPGTLTGSVPTLLFTTFQLTFAIITAALISGAIADRMKFAAWLVLVPVWTLLVYVPVAHWVWGPGGWIAHSSVPWTSPVASWWRSRAERRVWHSPWWWARGSASRRTRCARTTCRW